MEEEIRQLVQGFRHDVQLLEDVLQKCADGILVNEADSEQLDSLNGLRARKELFLNTYLRLVSEMESERNIPIEEENTMDRLERMHRKIQLEEKLQQYLVALANKQNALNQSIAQAHPLPCAPSQHCTTRPHFFHFSLTSPRIQTCPGHPE